MATAPQPPHERAWRHPSELAPTALDVSSSNDRGGRAMILASGVAAVMLTAVMVVALAPPSAGAPVTVTATTLPAATVQLRSSSAQIDDGDTSERSADIVQIDRNTVSRDNALALVGSPKAVSAAPAADAASSEVAERRPAPRDRVYLLTQSHAYVLRWSQLDQVSAPDGAVVVTADGELLATFANGKLRLLVD